MKNVKENYTSSNTKSVNDLTSGTDNFTISQNQKTQANDYSYDEYKKLSAKEINEIFPWDKMPNENEKAHKLQLIATLSPDETLNQVLFDQAKNADFNDISTRNFFDRTLATKRLEEAMLSFNQYETSDEEFLKTLSQKDKLALAKDSNNKVAKTVNYTDSLAKEIDGIVDAKTYFDSYEMSKNYFKEYGKDLSEYSQKYWPNEFALFDKVKSEYEKRVSQNDTMLNQLTYNTKPNPLDINI